VRGLELYEAGKFAVPVAEEFIAIAMARFGEQHPLFAEDIGGLGVLYQALDRPSEAEPLLKRALSIKEIALRADHTQVGDALYYLGLEAMRWTKALLPPQRPRARRERLDAMMLVVRAAAECWRARGRRASRRTRAHSRSAACG
jgi:hypothetical protein